jgi:hypothetical protein
LAACAQRRHDRFQRGQRFPERRDGDDLESVGVAARFCGVRRRDDEDVGVDVASAQRLLRHPADRKDVPVQVEGPGHRDAAAGVDVGAELVDDVEREREAGGRTADVPRIDPNVDRKLELGLDDHSHERPPLSLGRARSDLELPPRALAVEGDRDRVARPVVAQDVAQALRRGHLLSLRGNDHVARLELPVGRPALLDGDDLGAARGHGMAEATQRDGDRDLL